MTEQENEEAGGGQDDQNLGHAAEPSVYEEEDVSDLYRTTTKGDEDGVFLAIH